MSKADLKKIWFAVLLPTHPNQALPQKIIAFLRIFVFVFYFSLILLTNSFFKIIKRFILLDEIFRDCYTCILTLYTAFVGEEVIKLC